MIKQFLEYDNYSKWLKVNNPEQIEWTKNYLIEHGHAININYNNSDMVEVRMVVLAWIDLIGYRLNYMKERNIKDVMISQNMGIRWIPTSDKTLAIKKLKSAWSQQKFRNAGKTKTNYHLPLTKQTKHRLEKLSEIKGVSTTAMLDILINSAYEKYCMDTDGNDLY